MKVRIGNKGEYRVVPFFSDEDHTNALFDHLKERDLFSGKVGEAFIDVTPNGSREILWGLGEKAEIKEDVLRLAAYRLAKELARCKITEAGITLPLTDQIDPETTARALTEGFYQATYRFDKFITEREKFLLKRIFLKVPEEEEAAVQRGIDEGSLLIRGIFLTRELINEPAMYLYPKTLAKRACEVLEPLGVTVKVFKKKEIEEIGMKAYLAVAQGSARPPRFIVMEYMGNPDSEDKLALVGKGLTYDSGGYCIKPPKGMATMHCDMGGAATVIGAIHAIAEAKLPVNVIGFVAAAENMISGNSYKTGDIIGSLKGTTIEVDNTDAEGRLTLADALYYAADNYHPTAIVDLATLTGACVVALGELYAGAVTNNQDFMDEVLTASKNACEYIWQMPVCDGYRELIKSKVADLKNIGIRGAGMITAGLFLEPFVEDIPWVHLDIAGTAFTSAATGYLPEGGTGNHVKTLYYLAKGRQ